jgi:serine/threonine-protein kinase SRPK3
MVCRPYTLSPNCADVSLAIWAEHHFTGNIQTQQYHCLGVMLDAKWGTSANIWSVASVVSLVPAPLPVGLLLTLLCCRSFELIAGGDYLFDPASGSRYSKGDDRVAQIIALITFAGN